MSIPESVALEAWQKLPELAKKAVEPHELEPSQQVIWNAAVEACAKVAATAVHLHGQACDPPLPVASGSDFPEFKSCLWSDEIANAIRAMSQEG